MFSSPVDDFRNGTLGAVPGTLGKLRYLASLRGAKGNYYHWGLARAHGESIANTAIGEAHTDVLISVLRTPIRSLWEEAKSMAADQDEPVGDYLRELTELGEALVPKELQGGVKRHFMSVLLALCSLAGVRAPLKTGLAA
jgi:hypothetical protein